MQISTISVDAQNRESTRHGTHGFPMAVYNSILSRNVLGYTRLHWHEELQFCAVVQGTVTFSVNEASWRLETGDGIFINSGYLHMARPLGNPDAAISVWISIPGCSADSPAPYWNRTMCSRPSQILY